MARYMFAIDVDRCLGCQSCIVGCKLQNQVALGNYLNAVYNIGPFGDYPHTQMYFLPVMCQHCGNPPCVDVCLTKACYLDRKTGLVQINRDKCVGCKCCVQSCPYQAITFNQQMRISDKCSACASIIGDLDPVCVKICPGSAIYFGDIEDAESKISKFLSSQEDTDIYHLADRGTNPSTCYILRNGTWLGKDLELWMNR